MKPILDANTLSYFAHAGALRLVEQAAHAAPVRIVDEVEEELLRPKGPPGIAAWLDDHSKKGNVVVESLAVGSPAQVLFAALRAARATGAEKDKGEHASIAWAVHEAEAVFVTDDKNGLYLAAQETGTAPARTCRTLGWLRWAKGRGAKLDMVLCGKLAGKVPKPLPSWWAGWVGGR